MHACALHIVLAAIVHQQRCLMCYCKEEGMQVNAKSNKHSALSYMHTATRHMYMG